MHDQGLSSWFRVFVAKNAATTKDAEVPLPLLVPQGDKRIDVGGASRRYQCRADRYRAKHHSDGHERRRIEWSQAEQHACEIARERGGSGQPQCDADKRKTNEIIEAGIADSLSQLITLSAK